MLSMDAVHVNNPISSWMLFATRSNLGQKANGLAVKSLASMSGFLNHFWHGLTKINSYRFWQNAIRTATPSAQRRFVNMFDLYLDSVVQQAEDRTHNYIRDIQSYFDVRRDTIGAKPSFAINEIHLNIADEVMEDPIIKSLTLTSIDMLIIGNDLCSYNVE